MLTTTTKVTRLQPTNEPDQPSLFSVGQLVTCAGPFNSGQDDQGYWRQVEAIVGIRWDPPFRGFKGRRLEGFWRISIPGWSGPERDLSPAPEGAKVGDIIRTS